MTTTSPNNNEWFSFDGLEVARAVEHDICFDGALKLYSLTSSDAGFSEVTKGALFLDFHYVSNGGVFLREIKSPSAWPTTYLVFVDARQKEKHFVLSSQSSYSSWFVEPKGTKEFNLITAVGPREYEAYSIKFNSHFQVSQYWP